MTAVMVNGITLVIIPLLALTADQMANVMNAMQIDGSIEAHNMDATTRHSLTNDIIPRMDEIPYDYGTVSLCDTMVTPSPKHRSQRRRPTNDLPGHCPFWGSRPPEAPPPWPPPLQSRQLLDSIVPFITVDIIDLLYLPSSHLPQQPY